MPGKMNTGYKKSWVRALRSGKFTQGYMVLFNGRDYCCLGVLYKIAGGKFEDDGGGYYRVHGNSQWLGTTFGRSVGICRETQRVLSDLNDGRKKTFSEIADWIEVNL